MNVYAITVFAAALAAAGDVSHAAQPAAIKSIQAAPVSLQSAEAESEPIIARQDISLKRNDSISSAGKQAQQQVLAEALHALRADTLAMPSPALMAQDSERVATAPQIASK